MSISIAKIYRPLIAVLALTSLMLDVSRGQTRPGDAAGNSNPVHAHLLVRHYRLGEKIVYHMTGTNQADHYEAQATGVVKSGPSGDWFEEIAWSNLIVNGKPVNLPAESKAFRQRLTLDPSPGNGLAVPSLNKVHPALIGPITDLLNFYADWQAASRVTLTKPGDHATFPIKFAPSWADGNRVILGEDSIDFNITLKDIDAQSQVAMIVVRHVPPAKPLIKIPVEWMRTPVADTPNNWVEVSKNPDGTYSAEVGKETFDVEMKIDLATGRIISGSIVNIVEVLHRTCIDAALMNAGNPVRFQIKREIEIQ